jgi:hypothetical protein
VIATAAVSLEVTVFWEYLEQIALVALKRVADPIAKAAKRQPITLE